MVREESQVQCGVCKHVFIVKHWPLERAVLCPRCGRLVEIYDEENTFFVTLN